MSRKGHVGSNPTLSVPFLALAIGELLIRELVNSAPAQNEVAMKFDLKPLSPE